MKVNKLIIIIVILILFVYIRFYLRPNSTFEILQLSVRQLRPHHLFEKSPIVITDLIVDPKQLLVGAFRYLYITTSLITPYKNIDLIKQNKSKFMIIHALQNTRVSVYHPKYSRILKRKEYAQFVDIELAQHQTLVLPMFWWFKPSKYVNIIYMDDIITNLLGNIFTF